MNAISKGQEFQIRKKLLKFRCHQSPGKFICEGSSKWLRHGKDRAVSLASGCSQGKAEGGSW